MGGGMRVYLLIWENDPIGVYKSRREAQADAAQLQIGNFHIYEFVVK